MPRIVVNPVTRIEGHAKIYLDVDDKGQVESGQLKVLELRGFEKLVDKMELFKMPLITGRICGVCPAAHHLASVTAIENGLGVDVPTEARLLRELLYVGHMLHSHALSVFVLSGPDLVLGLDAPPQERNVFHILKVAPELAKKVLTVRSIGQRIVEVVGGRGIHPVTAVPGGMASRPTPEKLTAIASWGKQAVEIVEELAGVLQEKLAALGDFQEKVKLPLHSVALTNNGSLSYLEGECVVLDPVGGVAKSFHPADYGDHLVEHVMPESYMKSVRLRGSEEQSYFVGPLARLNVNKKLPTPHAQAMLDNFHSGGKPRRAMIDFIGARAVEMVHCAERICQITGGELSGGPIRVDCAPKEGRYVGLVEAPRGVLIHDYTADEAGRITSANLIVATQNNYDAINQSLKQAGELYLPKNDENLLMNGLEFTLRCFDPCLSCATHTAGRMPMEVIIRGNGEGERTLVRR